MSREEPGPVVVFGGGGWVGSLMALRLAARGCVLAPPSDAVDVRDRSVVSSFVAHHAPRAVLNLAACNPGQGDDGRMQAVNHIGATNVARAAATAGARLVHVSSDMVLDGEHAPYDECATPAPVNAYGRSKAEGERAVLALYPEAVAVRTSLVFDPAAIDRSTAGFARRLEEEGRLVLFSDEIRMPIARSTLVSCLVELVDGDVSGVLNVAGAEPLSRHVFGLRLLEWFGVRGLERVEGAQSAPLGLARPRDLTLILTRARRVLTTPLRTLREELDGHRPHQRHR